MTIPLIVGIVEWHPHRIPGEDVEGHTSDVVQDEPLVDLLHELHSREAILKAWNIVLLSIPLQVPQHGGYLHKNAYIYGHSIICSFSTIIKEN